MTAQESRQLDMFEMADPNPAMYSVLDFETGGLKEKVNGLCSVAIISLGAELEELNRFYALLYEPGKVYEAEALRVNGFTLDTLEKEGLRPDEFIPILHSLIDGSVVICHNAQFDVRWLNARGWNIQEAICTMENDFAISPYQKHKLGLVYNRYFGHDFVGAHNALADVEAAIEVLRWQKAKDAQYLNPKPINWDRFKR